MTNLEIAIGWAASGAVGAFACMVADAAGLRWEIADVAKLIRSSRKLQWILAGLWALGPISIVLATVAVSGHAFKRLRAQ